MQGPDIGRGGVVLAGGILAFVLVAVFFDALCESKPGEIAAALATIIAGSMALAAAGIGAFWIRKQIVAADTHEKDRIRRRFSAARAGLPLTLSTIYKYVKVCTGDLTRLLDDANHGNGAEELLFKPSTVPKECTSDLLNIIEVADDYTADYLAVVVQRLQIHRSRITNLTIRFHPDGTVSNKHEVISQLGYLVILGALIDNLFPYARRMCDSIPELSARTINNTFVGLVMARDRYDGLDVRVRHLADEIIDISRRLRSGQNAFVNEPTSDVL